MVTERLERVSEHIEQGECDQARAILSDLIDGWGTSFMPGTKPLLAACELMVSTHILPDPEVFGKGMAFKAYELLSKGEPTSVDLFLAAADVKSALEWFRDTEA